MRSIARSLLLAFVSMLASTVAVQAIAADRPRVGLVLGGGGARGAAHIGVLEVLAENHIRVDCVAGTSMGALVAGGFAAGLSSKQMQDELKKANWRDMFIDSPDYSETAYRKKRIASRFVPGSEMGMTKSGVELPNGVVSGQKIRMFFNHLVQADISERNIEDLPLPLSIIATDIGNGERVVFRDGTLTSAMRASMSVPGLLAPVDHQNRKLVDGGLVDNVPIAEVRERCHPDVVIAVNVGSPLLAPGKVDSFLAVSAQMVNILTEQNVTRSLALLKPTDIYIKPDLDGLTAGDFERHVEAAALGRKAAEAVLPQLRALSVPDADYVAWWDEIAIIKKTAPVVAEVKISDMEWVNPATVERHLRVKPGDRLDPKTMYKDMQRIYGDGNYERVEYSMLRVRDKHLLNVTPVEKSWGPDYLRMGVALSTDLIDGADWLLRAAYHKTWLNSYGAELLLGGEVGSRPAITAEFYQPIDPAQHFFVDAAALLRRDRQGIYQNNDRLAEYVHQISRGTLSAGVNLGLLGQARLGWLAEHSHADLETGISSIDEHSISNQGWAASLDLDQLDQLYFPSHGWKSQIRYFTSTNLHYDRIDADIAGAYSLGDYVINARMARTASFDGPLPFHDAAKLGGLFNLSGFGTNQLLGGGMTYGHIRGERIIGRMPLGLRGDLRLGLAYEMGKVTDRYTETERAGWLNTTTLYFGGDTPIGPVYIGYGHSTQGSKNIYFQLGTP